MAAGLSREFDRRRIGWWLVAAALAFAVAFFVFSFLGMFVLGVFIYYGARPVNRRIQRRVDSRGTAATLTILFIVVPTLALLGYTAFVAIREFTAVIGSDAVGMVFEWLPGDQESPDAVAQNPVKFVEQLSQVGNLEEGLTTVLGVVGGVSTVLLTLTLSLSLAFFLYRDGHRLQAWYRREVGGRDTAAYSYLAAVDTDLEVVYFGNVLTVLAVTVGSVVFYNGYNFVAPDPVTLPFPTLLAILTGLATFVPLVVGKVVYVPAGLFLVGRAVQSDTSLLVYPLVFLVAAFVLLDLIPQSIVRPFISGQTMHEGAVLFAYILGAVLFGWYGLFLGPLVLVLVVQFVNVVLGELIRGEPFTPAPTGATDLGTNPDPAKANTADGAVADDGELPGEANADDERGDDGSATSR